MTKFFAFSIFWLYLASINAQPDETVLTDQDFANIGKLRRKSQLRADLLIDGTEKGNELFEGDINLNGRDLRDYIVLDGDDPDSVDNAIVNPSKKWPGAQVPYTISTSFEAWERAKMAEAIQAYHSNTCIRLVPRTTQRNYIHIMRSGGCWSMVGMTGGRQVVSIGNGCVWTGIIIHELMHAVGFWHEQSRNDRDSYVRIFLSEVSPGLEHNFDKYSLKSISHLGTAYDYRSIMHYGAYAFSSTGRMTIQPIYADASDIGQRDKLSENDIRKLNILYNCGTVVPVQTTTTTTTRRTTTTTRPRTTTRSGDCKDTRSDCSYFSSSCNEGWTQESCAYTCGHCKKTLTTVRPRPGGRPVWIINDK